MHSTCFQNSAWNALGKHAHFPLRSQSLRSYWLALLPSSLNFGFMWFVGSHYQVYYGPYFFGLWKCRWSRAGRRRHVVETQSGFFCLTQSAASLALAAVAGSGCDARLCLGLSAMSEWIEVNQVHQGLGCLLVKYYEGLAFSNFRFIINSFAENRKIDFFLLYLYKGKH